LVTALCFKLFVVFTAHQSLQFKICHQKRSNAIDTHIFPIYSALKQGDALSLLLFYFASEFDVRELSQTERTEAERDTSDPGLF